MWLIPVAVALMFGSANANMFGFQPNFGGYGQGGFGGFGNGGFNMPGFGFGERSFHQPGYHQAHTYNPARANWQSNNGNNAPQQHPVVVQSSNPPSNTDDNNSNGHVITHHNPGTGSGFSNWQTVRCTQNAEGKPECRYANSESPDSETVSNQPFEASNFFAVPSVNIQQQSIPSVPVMAPAVQAPPMPSIPKLKSSGRWNSWMEPAYAAQPQQIYQHQQPVRQLKSGTHSASNGLKVGADPERCSNKGRVDDHCFGFAGAVLRYRYNVRTGQCTQFYGCTPTVNGSPNNFASKDECDWICRPALVANHH